MHRERDLSAREFPKDGTTVIDGAAARPSAYLNANGAVTGSITAPLFNGIGRQSFPIANPNSAAVVAPSPAPYSSPSPSGTWPYTRPSTVTTPRVPVRGRARESTRTG